MLSKGRVSDISRISEGIMLKICGNVEGDVVLTKNHYVNSRCQNLKTLDTKATNSKIRHPPQSISGNG